MDDLTCYIGTAILAGDDLQVVRDQALLVQSGRILEVGVPIPSAVQVDLSGKLLCPMFINAHTHVGDTGAKELGVGLPVEKAVSFPDGLKHRFLQSVTGTATHISMMRDGLTEMLFNGTIATADFREQGIAGVRALRQAAENLPMRVIVVGRMAETGTPEQIEAEAHAILSEADGLGVRDARAYPTAVMQRLRNEYPDKIFAAHAAESFSSEMDCRERTGRGQAANLLDWHPDFLVHLVHTCVEEIQVMASAGIPAVACPRCNGILGDGQPRLAEWARCGLRFGLGTDNVMFNSPDMLREMDFASRLVRGQERDAAVLEPRQFLKAATIEGARILKLERELGSLSSSKEASFIAFDLNSPNLKFQQDPISAIVHRATPADIASIWIKGEQIK